MAHAVLDLQKQIDTHGKEECVKEGLNWLEHRNVGNKCTIPEELHQESTDNHKDQEHNEVVNLLETIGYKLVYNKKDKHGCSNHIFNIN